MHRMISLFIVGCLLLNNIMPAFAFGGNCDVPSMLKSSQHEQWLHIDCLDQATSYLEKHPREKKKSRNVCINAASQIVKYAVSLFRQGQADKASRYDIPLKKFAITSGIPLKAACVTREGKQVPCSPSDKLRNNVLNQIAGQEQMPADSSVLIIESSGQSFDFYFGNGKENSELTAKLTRLAQMNKEHLGNVIDVLVVAGRDNPSDPDYVHPLILEGAFMFYAQKLDPAEKRNISYYLENSSPRVRWAAANALASYAQNGRNTAGKFVLSAHEKTQIEAGFSVAAAVGVLAVPAEAVRSSAVLAEALAAPAAPASVVVAGVVFFYYALNDAYSSGYKAEFNRAKEMFWDSVFSPEASSNVESYPAEDVSAEDGVLSFVVAWMPDMEKLGGLTTATTTTKTKRKPTCEYRPTSPASEWTLNKLHEYVNNGDPRSIARLAELRRCLGQYSFCPAEVVDEKRSFAGCSAISLKNMSGVHCATRDIQQLVRVNEAASSFYAKGTNQKLFTRAIYKENIEFAGGVKINASGRWIPEAELGIRFNDLLEEAPNIFTQEIRDIIKRELSGFLDNISNTFSLGNYRSFRLGDHERSTKYRWNQQDQRFDKKQTDKPYQHFHYEEFLTYPSKNPYLCNHSIYYPIK